MQASNLKYTSAFQTIFHCHLPQHPGIFWHIKLAAILLDSCQYESVYAHCAIVLLHYTCTCSFTLLYFWFIRDLELSALRAVSHHCSILSINWFCLVFWSKAWFFSLLHNYSHNILTMYTRISMFLMLLIFLLVMPWHVCSSMSLAAQATLFMAPAACKYFIWPMTTSPECGWECTSDRPLFKNCIFTYLTPIQSLS